MEDKDVDSQPSYMFEIAGREIPIILDPGITVPIEVILASTTWRELWARHTWTLMEVYSITIQSVDMFGKRVGFIKISCTVKRASDGSMVPGIAFVRGGTIVMLPVVTCEGQNYLILGQQLRFPVGGMVLEALAGMMDDDTFSGAAAKELQQEAGITVAAHQLHDMVALLRGGGDSKIWFSPGGSDESARFLLCRFKASRDWLGRIAGSIHGEGPHEQVELMTHWLHAVPLGSILRVCSDAKTLVAVAFLQELMNKGMFNTIPFANEEELV